MPEQPRNARKTLDMEEGKKPWLERIAAKVPDPVVLFVLMYAVLFAATVFAGGTTFHLPGIDPATGAATQVERSILDMSDAANVRWIFDNAIVANWLVYAHGLVGILVVATAVMILWFKLGLPFGF